MLRSFAMERINGTDILTIEAALVAPERQWIERLYGRADAIVTIACNGEGPNFGHVQAHAFGSFSLETLRIRLQRWRTEPSRILRPSVLNAKGAPISSPETAPSPGVLARVAAVLGRALEPHVSADRGADRGGLILPGRG